MERHIALLGCMYNLSPSLSLSQPWATFAQPCPGQSTRDEASSALCLYTFKTTKNMGDKDVAEIFYGGACRSM